MVAAAAAATTNIEVTDLAGTPKEERFADARFIQTGNPSCRPITGVKALKGLL